MIRITRHAHPESLEDPEVWALKAETALWNQELLRVVGDDEMAETVPARFAEGARPHYSRWVRFVARDSDEVCGTGLVEMPQQDNTHLAFTTVVVDPAHRRRGVGSALLAAVLDEARRDGRRSFEGWSWVDPDPSGPDLLRAITRGVVAADDPAAAFLLPRGFRLNQVERVSRMELPSQEVLEQGVAPVAEGYRIETWTGRTPDNWVPDLGGLLTAMSTDVPHGEAEWDPEVFDAARVASNDDGIEAAQRDQFVTAMLHEASRRLVGFTRVIVDRSNPRVAHQWETLVIASHRGHGLGLAMKTHSHANLRRHWPGVGSIDTGNAEENGPMLAINEALGFRPHAAAAWWALTES